MNTDEFNVLHGLDANLPETKSDNILYHTTDTHRTFIGVTELQNKEFDGSSTHYLSGCTTIVSAITALDEIIQSFEDGNNISY